jgi:hypothetical protein
MTPANDILRDAFDRVHELVPEVVEGLSVDELLWRPDPDANPVGWLVWHLTRVQDDHLAGIAGTEQLWTAEAWVDRFGLPYDAAELGYGQDTDEVGAFRVEGPELLTGYHEAVHLRTVELVGRLDDAGLARIVDRRFDPPVTAAARLVSVVNDIGQHIGQAAYVRGMLERRRDR